MIGRMGFKVRTLRKKTSLQTRRSTFDETLAERVRVAIGPRPDVVERKMFGGLAFMIGGNMACGIAKNELMLRVGPDAWQDALEKPHTRPMDFTGRPLKGMVYVTHDGIDTDRKLKKWIARGVDFASSLPAK